MAEPLTDKELEEHRAYIETNEPRLLATIDADREELQGWEDGTGAGALQIQSEMAAKDERNRRLRWLAEQLRPYVQHKPSPKGACRENFCYCGVVDALALTEADAPGCRCIGISSMQGCPVHDTRGASKEGE